MALPSVGTTEWNEIASAHLYKFLERDPIDNYSKAHPLLAFLRKNQSTHDGGKPAWPVFYGRTAIGRSYTGGQATSPVGTQATTMAETDVAFWAEPIVVYHTDQVKAGGADKLFDYMKVQYKAAKAGLTRQHATLLWAASKSSTTDPDSIPLAVPVDPTASVAFNGLNGAAGQQTFWRNQTQTCTGSWSSDGINKLDALCNLLAEEGFEPEILVTTRAVFQFMQQEMRGRVAFNRGSTATGKMLNDLGVPYIEHNGIPVIHDFLAPSGKIFALNSQCIEWVVQSGGDYTYMGDGFESLQTTGVMGSVAHLRLEGFLRVRNRRGLGQVDTITSA